MRRYAEKTNVSVEKSEAQIKSLVIEYGATKFQTGWEDCKAMIGFVLHDRGIRFTLPLPSKYDAVFRVTPGGRRARSEFDAALAWEQACRSLWRALYLSIRAKLEAVECNISTFEEEFLSHIIVPATGSTVGETLIPDLEKVYAGQRRLTLISDNGSK